MKVKLLSKTLTICVAIVLVLTLMVPLQLITSNKAAANSNSVPISGNITFQFDEIGQSMGWSDGSILSGTYTLQPTQSDPSVPGDQSIQLVGNENMEYREIAGQKAIGFKSNTKQNGGYFKIHALDGYDIASVSYNLRAYDTPRTMPDVACVCATAPYYDEEHTEWWDWKIPDSVSWWLTEFTPDYYYVPQDSDFYISAWNVKDNERLAISAIGVTYTKKIPKCTVSGQVKDINDQPVEGVIVSSLRPNATTTTDSSGNWSLTVAAYNDTTFVFTKDGYYESSLNANLENLTEYIFTEPYIIIDGVKCVFDSNGDARHKNFEIESWLNGVKTGSSEYNRHVIKGANEATISCEEDGRLHYDYTDINNLKHTEIYLKGLAKDGYYFIGWELDNDNGQTIKPGQEIILDANDGEYQFIPVYSDNPPAPPVPPLPPQPDDPQTENINSAQTGESTAFTALVLIVASAAIIFVRQNRKRGYLF